MEIGAFEAENALDSLLDRVEKGEEIIISRRGKPVARLAPVRAERDVARARKAMALALAVLDDQGNPSGDKPPTT